MSRDELSKLKKAELKEMLKASLDLLTEKEKQVILLYYYEELTLKEISYTLEVTEVNGKRDYYTISNEALINKIFDKYAKELKKKNIN